MFTGRIQVRRSAVILAVTLIVLAAIIAVAAPKWASAHEVPVYVAASARPEATLPANGFGPVVKSVLPAVVNISSSKIVRTPAAEGPFNDPFFRQFFGNDIWRQFHVPRERREQSLGSGVIVSPDGYIVTNNHVVDGATQVKVFLPDKREFTGRVIGTDPKTDIAVVKIDATHLPTLVLGNSSKLEVGDYVLAVGDPFGIGETVTMGIVSAKGRGGLDIEDYEDFIQTDAAINPGNSGGALINARGELIGINTAILTGGGNGSQGVGFAIPLNLARYVADQLMKTGKVVRGYLGAYIQELTPALQHVFNAPSLKGALLSEVEPGGPAAKAGLERGDIVTAVDGQAVANANDLRLRVAQTPPNTQLHLTVLRNGKQMPVAVTVGTLPEKSAEAPTGGSQSGSPMAGVQVQTLTPDIAQQLQLPAGTKGVVVSRVQPGSDADMAGLQRGDVIQEVNRKPVATIDAYQDAVQAAGSQPIVLLVNRGGQTTFIVVQPQ